jgi:hypothetical protein
MKPRRPDFGKGAILLKLIRRLSPVRDESRFTDSYWDDVYRELRWYQVIAEVLCVAGLMIGFFLPMAVTGAFHGWDIGIGFGLMVLLPCAYLLVVCAAKGFKRTYSRWADYSTMMYAIPWKSQQLVYCTVLAIGFICLVGRATFPHGW